MPKFPMKMLRKAELEANDENCIIKSNALALVAKEMDSASIFKRNPTLGRFLLSCGVRKTLCEGLILHIPFKDTGGPYSAENILHATIHPTPRPSTQEFEEYNRAMLIYRILVFYSCGRGKNKKVLFNILENLGNPLYFESNAPRALRFQKKIDQHLIGTGYALKDGVVVKSKRSSVTGTLPRVLTLSLKGRQIWVNDRFLLSQPHFVSGNVEFFEHLLENTGAEITRENLPIGIAKMIQNRRFPKILNALGFKGELLKAFFSKRSKKFLVFNKSVSSQELKKRGVECPMLLAELSQAHSRNIQIGPK